MGVTGAFVLQANSIQFQVVPEPTLILASALGAAAIFRWRRRFARRAA
jgi:hypothetical protein